MHTKMNLSKCEDCDAVFNGEVHRDGCPMCHSHNIGEGLSMSDIYTPWDGASEALNSAVFENTYNLILRGQVM